MSVGLIRFIIVGIDCSDVFGNIWISLFRNIWISLFLITV